MLDGAGSICRDVSCGNVERGEQRCRAMSDIVMSSPLRLAWTHGQHRLTAIERLDLRLLVDAQHQRMRRRRDVETDNVTHLGDEVGIGRQLEGIQPMRLQPECAPDALDSRHRQPACSRHAARTPLGGVSRQALQRLDDHRLDPLIVRCPRRARARLVAQTVEPVGQEPTAPFADRQATNSQPRSHLYVGAASNAAQHDPGSKRQRLRRFAPCRQSAQLDAFPLAPIQARCSTISHFLPP